MLGITEVSAFWFDNTWSLGVMLRFLSSFMGGALIPLKFFPTWGQNILAYTPFPYLIDFPYQVMQGNFTVIILVKNILILSTWTLVFFGIYRLIWSRGKYQYSGVGI